MNISITPELEELIEKKVKSGLYNSASEVIREGLRLLKDAAESEVFFTYGKTNFMGMGENNARVEQMVTRANKLIADPDLAEEAYSDWLDHYHDLLKKGEQREAEEDTIIAEIECREMAKTPKYTRRWSGGSPPSSIDEMYTNVRNAMFANAEPDAMPSSSIITSNDHIISAAFVLSFINMHCLLDFYLA